MAYSEAQKKATMKYKAKAYEPMNIDVKKGMKDIYKAQAAKRGMSLAGYVQFLIERDMKEDENL